ncbi:MAG: AbrB/MazE/SpoVT family DNA-binding domain-containing protein [Candidatus Freyarchaeum deiterrae]
MSEEVSIVGKKFIVVIPKNIRKTLGIKEGQKIRFKVEQGKIHLEPIIDPFELAIKGSKFAEITVEEFESESEEMQNEFFKD